MKSEIYAIFPEPIYKTKLERDFTKEETLFFNHQKNDVVKNKSNLTSKNTYVLNDSKLSNLHNDLMKFVNDYFNKIIQTKNDVTPYITQSWINYTNEGERHHIHKHHNSLVSGVLYINANKNLDGIKFEKKEDKQIMLELSNFNLFNSSSWFFNVETLDVLLFPSNLSHQVDVKKGENERISLAFNIFIKGKIGENLNLTELIL